MDKKFYRNEIARVKGKNYVYYTIIGVIWASGIILMSTRYQTTVPYMGELHTYSFFQFLFSLKLMSLLSNDLFYVNELGKKSGRLKKYECTPISKKQCCLAYAVIMAKYLLIMTAGSLFVFFGMAWLTENLHLGPKTGWGLLTFLLVSAAAYLWILIRCIRKNSR